MSRHSYKLQWLWVVDYIEDTGLEEIADYCKDLEELKVFSSDPYAQELNVSLTERDLVAVSAG
uniref:Glutaredoxin n=1 Tax=Solanum tuberosum TaxID=4113 RepID=M1A353_SOLTU